MTLLTGVIALLVLPLALGPCILCRDGWRSSSPGGHGTCSWHGGIDFRLVVPEAAKIWRLPPLHGAT